MTADLVRLARDGDHGAFETLIRAGYDRLFTTDEPRTRTGMLLQLLHRK